MPRNARSALPAKQPNVRASRSGRPIMALLDLLGRRWTLRILWELRAQPLTSRALRTACDEASPTRTRLPAGASGPAMRQMVSSIFTVPDPSMIGFSSVNTRPTSAAARLLRKRLLSLDAPRPRASRSHSGTAAAANTANIRSCACQDGCSANDTNPANSAATPSQNRKTPGAISSSAIRRKPKISQFQVPSVENISVMTRPSILEHDLFGKPVPTHHVVARGHAFPDHALPYCSGSIGGGLGPAVGTEVRCAAAAAEAALSPNVALAISPMPASAPSMLIASTGSIKTFWFGDDANCPNALMYLSAMK